ncbi:MAG TPA: lysylphosphatidylglycerol synthase domain-containing protein [Vicinamibacterales bacterium]|nr:lysylphosphatidylglycerol synthase domain-containing protein [Vicinamibacterales bacterium]
MRHQRLIAVVAALLGAALFVYAVRRAGVSEIIDAVRRVGWGLVLIFALAGLRFLVRAECWRWCLPPHTAFPLRRAFAAFLAGDSVGNITPLGLLASEPTKVLLTRHHLATREAVASLAVENLVYAASVLAMVAVGLIVVAANVAMPAVWRSGLFAALGALILGAGLALRAMRGTWDPSRGARPRWRERLASMRDEAARFSGGHPERLWRVFALDLVFHALAVLEVYITLEWLLVDRSPTIVEAVAFEALNRVITAAFKFVPFRVGIDEATAGALAPILSVNPAAGVALAVVRKVRNLFWAALGLVPVATHPAGH